jgi:4-hydroxybenzoate polyprenyltransferase
MSGLRPWAQLVRVPNTLTSCADVLAGMCLAGGFQHHFGFHPIAALVASIASICFYWGGMVLNDVFDIAQDREQGRPGPLVTGKISVRSAALTGSLLLIGGIALSMLAPFGFTFSGEQVSWTQLAGPGLLGCLLAAAVYAYDGPAKKSIFAPAIMGLCRSLNIALGVAVVAAVFPVSLGNAIGCVVIGHGMYITGLTIAARREADLSQSRGRLTLGWGICALGAAMISISCRLEPDRPYRLEPNWGFPLLVAILLLPLARRAYHSIASLHPQHLGLAIKQAIMSILFLDASIALQYAGNLPGICIAIMVLPTVLLARWFRAT